MAHIQLTVQDLIDKLKKQPKDALVQVNDYEDINSDVIEVSFDKNVVCIYTW